MKVAVLVSGGVDSSVALRLLARERRHRLVAVYLKIWLEDELSHLGECPWEDDLLHARRVCAATNVPLHVVSLQRRYHEIVVARALAELRAGRTPSPDILCNRRIKFEATLDALDEIGVRDVEAMASGHYARVRTTPDGRPSLWQGVDPVKDQTYFLHRLTADRLGRLLFPLGELTKPEVRNLALTEGLPNADRPDSQGICFLGRIPFTEFVRQHLGERPGEIVDRETGRVLGEHRGHWFHTIGQRRGLGLAGGPSYVVGKDLEGHRLLVAHGERPADRRRGRFRIRDVHWILGCPPSPDRELSVRIRHGPRTLPARVAPSPDGLQAEVHLAEAAEGVAPGQACVIYAGAECLGGGWIRTDDPETDERPIDDPR